ncbi:unnamed protein product [Trichobilharzia regenti]|nr:unnamed protein product [Trichobilharzia regenti]
MRAIQPPHNPREIEKLSKGRLTNSETACPKIYLDGIAYADSQVMCELFNKHYARLHTLEIDQVVDFPPKTDGCLGDILFTTQEIDKAVANIKHSNTIGPDGIPSILLKNGGNHMNLLLLKLSSISPSNGTHPTCW